MGAVQSRLSDADIDKGRRVLQRLSGYLRSEEGISDRREEASLGILRLDYDYPSAPGDIDHPKTFGYRVHYRAVPGLTFEMCQEGTLTSQVEAEFVAAIRWLDDVKHVHAITGDCGFMFWFQELARQHTKKPVCMSSLVQLPSITCAFAIHEQIAILTANSKTLTPMHDLIVKECGVRTEDTRYVIVGCEAVPGFEAVAYGEKVDTKRVQPGIVDLVKATIAKHPGIRALLLECTELPPYADALRYSTGLPVYDAVTCADSFVDGVLDNPRFGLMGWMRKFDGKQHKYKLGVELGPDERVRCQHCGGDLVHEVSPETIRGSDAKAGSRWRSRWSRP